MGLNRVKGQKERKKERRPVDLSGLLCGDEKQFDRKKKKIEKDWLY